jgi:hypothetical protein
MGGQSKWEDNPTTINIIMTKTANAMVVVALPFDHSVAFYTKHLGLYHHITGPDRTGPESYFLQTTHKQKPKEK